MALKKNITLPSGVALDYARIDSLVYDRIRRMVTIQVSGYVDQAHAQNGAAPVTNIGHVTLEGDEAEILLVALHDACGALAYPAVKAAPQFEGAVDV